MIRKLLFWSVLVYSILILYFNTVMFLEYMTSMKYEVEHSMAIKESEELLNREREIIRILVFNKIIYGFIALVLVGNFTLIRRSRQGKV